MTALLVALGGGLGAVARWGIASIVPKTRAGFPLGVTVVNVVGSFLLGFVVATLDANDVVLAVEPITIGLLGGFTTFSTWMIDVDEAPSNRMGGAIVVIPLTLGMAAAGAGMALASSI
jgi:CrcB protein